MPSVLHVHAVYGTGHRHDRKDLAEDDGQLVHPAEHQRLAQVAVIAVHAGLHGHDARQRDERRDQGQRAAKRLVQPQIPGDERHQQRQSQERPGGMVETNLHSSPPFWR